MSDRVKNLLQRNKKLEEQVSNWNSVWQTVGEYVTQVKTNFEQTLSPGEFLNEEIFDSTATFALANSSSALLGLLWPSNSKKAIEITPPDDMEDLTDEERNWYELIATKRLTGAMDDPKANLALALDEYMLDQIAFGTSGIGVFFEDRLIYRSFSIKEMRIDEGKDGRVDTVFINYDWTAKRVMDTYGEENVSEKIRELIRSEKFDEKIKVLVAYQAGEEGEFFVSSLHIEVQTGHILRDSGFEEFPIQVARFRKLSNEKYGRSPAMNALPDIKELNVLKEAVIIATGKILDPPLGVMNDGILGGGIVDTSSGALTVFDSAGNAGNAPPIFPINTIGDLNAALSRIQSLEQSIAQHFFIDRLLDFNNQTQMTATETVARAQIRNSSLSSLITRQITEMFTPLIERSFNIMLRNDKFGLLANTKEGDIAIQVAQAFDEEPDIIPERIAERIVNGEEAYQVRYTTPADRVTNTEELDGMIQLIGLNQQLAQTNPEAVMHLDIGKIQENAIRLFGAPPDIIKHEDEVAAELQQQQEQIAQQQQLNQAEQVAGIAGDIQQ